MYQIVGTAGTPFSRGIRISSTMKDRPAYRTIHYPVNECATLALINPKWLRIRHPYYGNRGGHETGNHSTTLDWLDYYSIDEDRWYTNLPDAPNPRGHTGLAMVHGRICVAGGRDGGMIGFFNMTVLPTDCYDPINKTWSVEADITQGRAGASYGRTCDGKLMVAGGEGYNRSWSRVDVFIGTGWTTVGNLSVARHGSGLAVDCLCHQIHIASGTNGQGGRSNEIRSIETLFPRGIDVACNA